MSQQHEREPGVVPLPSVSGAQPIPRGALYSRVMDGDRCVGTTITRFWRGDAEAAACRLCPRSECSYDPEFMACQVSTPEFVPVDQLLTYSGVGRRWADPAGEPAALGRADGSAPHEGPRVFPRPGLPPAVG